MVIITLIFCTVASFVLAVVGEHEIETYTFQSFPKDKIALHMPCEESNMFATKCMCHIKCIDNQCLNAKRICEKYRNSKGCKYMLIRGYQKKIATLKRQPMLEELSRFNITMYPRSFNQLEEPHWRTLKEQSKVSYNPKRSLRDLLEVSGSKGENILNKVFTVIACIV